MKKLGVIEIPNGLNSEFDHAAFDPRTRRVFIAHTARNCIEVIDHDAQKHVATLPGFPGVPCASTDRRAPWERSCSARPSRPLRFRYCSARPNAHEKRTA